MLNSLILLCVYLSVGVTKHTYGKLVGESQCFFSNIWDEWKIAQVNMSDRKLLEVLYNILESVSSPLSY